jgi:hypothetical protein
MDKCWLKPVGITHIRPNRSNLIFMMLPAAALMLSAVAAPSYAEQPAPNIKAAPQALWAVDAGGPLGISVFGKSGLAKKTGIVKPNGSVASLTQGPVSALTFDSAQDLWASLCNGPSQSGLVLEISAADFKDIAKGLTISPELVIEDSSAALTTPGVPAHLACPRGLGFDQLGNLWVEAEDTSVPELLEYTSAQLVANTQVIDPVPSSVISTASLDESVVAETSPPALAFDHDGNLWESGGISDDNPSDEIVVEYTATQLAAGDQATPDETLIVADNR